KFVIFYVFSLVICAKIFCNNRIYIVPISIVLRRKSFAYPWVSIAYAHIFILCTIITKFFKTTVLFSFNKSLISHIYTSLILTSFLYNSCFFVYSVFHFSYFLSLVFCLFFIFPLFFFYLFFLFHFSFFYFSCFFVFSFFPFAYFYPLVLC